MNACLPCRRGFHLECEECECEECFPSVKDEEAEKIEEIPSPVTEEEKEEEPKKKEEEELEPLQDRFLTKELKDRFSTGRKIASQLYPWICNSCKHLKRDHKAKEYGGDCIKEGCDCSDFEYRPCEWQGLKNAGGGKHPIVGCLDGTMSDRHHGPVKDTMRNEVGNVHRICATCHQRWHFINDHYYDEAEYSNLMPEPVPATEVEIFKYELDWRTDKMKERYTLKDLGRLKYD